MTARDADIGDNEALRYSMGSAEPAEAADKFAVHPYSGQVVVKALTAADANTEVTLTVVAQDKGQWGHQ